jgi:hypothetical protein
MVVEILAIAVSIVAIVVSVGAFLLQKWQGERIAVSVMNTVDQIYRRLKGTDPDDYLPEDIVSSSVSDRHIRRGTEVGLGLGRYLSRSVMGGLEARCIVEDPSGCRAEVVRAVELSNGYYGGFDLQVAYPREFEGASTSEPGRYHIWWYLRDKWVLIEGDQKTSGSTNFGGVEDAFTVGV